jgi:hypothetical protein
MGPNENSFPLLHLMMEADSASETLCNFSTVYNREFTVLVNKCLYCTSYSLLFFHWIEGLLGPYSVLHIDPNASGWKARFYLEIELPSKWIWHWRPVCGTVSSVTMRCPQYWSACTSVGSPSQKYECSHITATEQVAQIIILLTCIHEVPSSNLGWDVILIDVFHSFPPFLQADAEMLP